MHIQLLKNALEYQLPRLFILTSLNEAARFILLDSSKFVTYDSFYFSNTIFISFLFKSGFFFAKQLIRKLAERKMRRKFKKKTVFHLRILRSSESYLTELAMKE